MNNRNNQIVFWGCFIALVTTSMAFITRAILTNGGLWQAEFGFDKVRAGELFGAGIWPFAISIILFSLVIDKIGYKVAMFFSFICYAVYGVFIYIAYSMVNAPDLSPEALKEAQAGAWWYLYWGSVILGLGNGTVEAFINPVVATLFSKDKTKWLNILHAGWPGGLVLGGLITIGLAAAGVVAGADDNWLILVAAIVIPAIIYVLMLAKAEFPVNERVAAGASYKDMLAEFGAIGAFIASYLIVFQLAQVFGFSDTVAWIVTAVLTVAYGIYSMSLGKPVMIVLVLIMMPLAITELGTDSWISGLMEEPLSNAGWSGAWVLVYTSLIMMVLRFNVGPVVNKLGPLGLLATCAALAIIGLYLLSFAEGLFFIFLAATVYGVGKTYFWPTMLGVVAEQSPKGGALTLNAIAGIGMLTVGILGVPFIGKVQETTVAEALKAENEAVYKVVTETKDYILGDYEAVNADLLAAQPKEAQDAVAAIQKEKNQSALAKIVIFPLVMLIGYIALIFYYKSRGGYKPVAIADH